jgi:hypothetical protein
MLTLKQDIKYTSLTMVSANISIPELVDKIDLLGLLEHLKTKTEIINTTSGSSIIYGYKKF